MTRASVKISAHVAHLFHAAFGDAQKHFLQSVFGRMQNRQQHAIQIGRVTIVEFAQRALIAIFDALKNVVSIGKCGNCRRDNRRRIARVGFTSESMAQR